MLRSFSIDAKLEQYIRKKSHVHPAYLGRPIRCASVTANKNVTITSEKSTRSITSSTWKPTFVCTLR